MIVLKDVAFQYENASGGDSIRDITLTIADGETVLLCGESGCGKTTLTRLINGLIPHYYEGTLTGSVTIDGVNVGDQALYETAEKVGSVFQNPRSQFFNVDTNSELAFGCENRGMPEHEITARIASTVEKFHIESLMGRSIFGLSGGEKQKIACASVSVGAPDVVVLDEPSSNLDVFAINDLRRVLQTWKAEGKTIVIAEHRLYYVRRLADRIVYMKGGRVERVFTADELEELSEETLAAMGLRPLSLDGLDGSRMEVPRTTEVSLRAMTFAYPGCAPAVDIRELSVPKGSCTAVIGHNGAGKTTFSRCLCGLEKSCKGMLAEGDKNLRSRDRLKHCYMVMQDVNHQLFCESVLDEVLLSMHEENPAEADAILDSLDLLELREQHPMSLSGGQKQRVAIAAAIASGREYILFDEPTSGLDLRHMREVARNIEKLREMGKTLFVVSHDPQFILACCSHAVHMEKGMATQQYALDSNGRKQLAAYFMRIQDSENSRRKAN